MKPTTLKTERLKLRTPKLADADWIPGLANNINVARMVTTMPHPYSTADAEEFMSKAVDRWAQDTDFPFVIIHDQPMGLIGLHKRENKPAELGYWLGEPFWGHGYATEAARAVLRFGFETLHLQAVQAGYFIDNPTSGRVLEKAGLRDTSLTETRHSLGRGNEAVCRQYQLTAAQWFDSLR